MVPTTTTTPALTDSVIEGCIVCGKQVVGDVVVAAGFVGRTIFAVVDVVVVAEYHIVDKVDDRRRYLAAILEEV